MTNFIKLKKSFGILSILVMISLVALFGGFAIYQSFNGDDTYLKVVSWIYSTLVIFTFVSYGLYGHKPTLKLVWYALIPIGVILSIRSLINQLSIFFKYTHTENLNQLDTAILVCIVLVSIVLINYFYNFSAVIISKRKAMKEKVDADEQAKYIEEQKKEIEIANAVFECRTRKEFIEKFPYYAKETSFFKYWIIRIKNLFRYYTYKFFSDSSEVRLTPSGLSVSDFINAVISGIEEFNKTTSLLGALTLRFTIAFSVLFVVIQMSSSVNEQDLVVYIFCFSVLILFIGFFILVRWAFSYVCMLEDFIRRIQPNSYDYNNIRGSHRIVMTTKISRDTYLIVQKQLFMYNQMRSAKTGIVPIPDGAAAKVIKWVIIGTISGLAAGGVAWFEFNVSTTVEASKQLIKDRIEHYDFEKKKLRILKAATEEKAGAYPAIEKYIDVALPHAEQELVKTVSKADTIEEMGTFDRIELFLKGRKILGRIEHPIPISSEATREIAINRILRDIAEGIVQDHYSYEHRAKANALDIAGVRPSGVPNSNFDLKAEAKIEVSEPSKSSNSDSPHDKKVFGKK